MSKTSTPLLMTETVDIVTAYVAENSVPVPDLPKLIQTVHATLVGLGGEAPASTLPPAHALDKPTPAQIRKSITPDALISFIDSKPYKTLKRHLGTHGLTPDTYRMRYGLPMDYPATAPNYSAQRSALAKSLGLGQREPAQAA